MRRHRHGAPAKAPRPAARGRGALSSRICQSPHSDAVMTHGHTVSLGVSKIGAELSARLDWLSRPLGARLNGAARSRVGGRKRQQKNSLTDRIARLQARLGGNFFAYSLQRLRMLDHQNRAAHIQPDRPKFPALIMMAGALFEVENFAVKRREFFDIRGA